MRYSILMIILPIFVGSLATGEAIEFFSGHKSNICIFISLGLAVVGIATGIVNILKLIKQQR